MHVRVLALWHKRACTRRRLSQEKGANASGQIYAVGTFMDACYGIDGCFYPFEVGGISSPSLNSDAEIS
ncbi:unnamed protein product [Sphenostylis stenocarpa]|uniref:Uncharacterized protein n=1 Tax=Sphenostylis stenocarpa TaxID=92480 RepID=A0AA86TCM9_9FABA|nr:unnamed protein product [Sphenostylis stenocarpa]